MNKTILATGVFFGLTAVMLGAFGAHGLTDLVDAKALDSFGTGVQYQMYHAFFLMILSGIGQLSLKRKKLIYYFIVMGILCFSLSIYLLATNALTGFDFTRITLITPLGGILLITGWILLGAGLMKKGE
ncbi:MAG TPA: DUF423 domain-containing protein [Arenibacter sp.]|nr:DUF423 domain-containing protein [Arenibacter sp.]